MCVHLILVTHLSTAEPYTSSIPQHLPISLSGTLTHAVENVLIDV